MQTFENQTVSRNQCPVHLGTEERHNAIHVTRNVTLEDLEFFNCEFVGEGLTTYGSASHRSTARNIRLKDCRLNSFFGNGVVFDGVVVDGLRTSRMPVILNGCAFRHVTLAGHLGRFLINRNVTYDDDLRNEAFHAANAAFYDTVDWALDISNAQAACIEIRGAIPARLIRRNPDDQVAMTRDVALSGEWQHYDPISSFTIAVSIFLDSSADENVFVAARRSRHFKEEVAFFHRLRDAGLVS